jgi:hypothetical protein
VKRSWVITGVVIVAVLLVGGTLLMDRNRLGAQPAGSVSAGGSTGRTAGASGTSGTSKSSPSPQTNPVALERVATPPTHTLAFIDAKEFSADSTYAVTFVPYGTGGMPKSLIIEIVASKPSGRAAHPFDLTGHNALVNTSRLPLTMAVTKGGTYTGTIELVSQADAPAPGDVLALMLIDVSPAK